MLELRDVSKRYDNRAAVQNLNFTVKPGEVTGYLGPNGSGKSTTVKMLAGLLLPSTGDILWKGKSIARNVVAFKAQIGYVPEEAHLYGYLSGLEYLEFVGRLRRMPERTLQRRIESLLDIFLLGQAKHALLSSYSKGMRQKILITAALLHDPELLVFDEPLSGLDVTSALVFRHLLRLLALEGKAILYSSHVLEAVEQTCSSVVILSKGNVVAHDSVARLKELMSMPSLEHVFTRLAVPDDPRLTAASIVAAMAQG
ncbi:MAG: ABC transporter ATP-binding protein [Thermoanaerobaculia bacterium]